ncbi:hypothetical protein C8R45DRAFT_1115775 [Mycena sanguinolenta]|nr:hypothetical protein C8R45DRAFT_1115775 [Mycena sanguinolenta]
MSPRAASRAISANISDIAVDDITASDDDMEVTLVDISDGEEDQDAYNDAEKDSNASFSSSSSSDSSSSHDESDAPKKPHEIQRTNVPAKRKRRKKIVSGVSVPFPYRRVVLVRTISNLCHVCKPFSCSISTH